MELFVDVADSFQSVRNVEIDCFEKKVFGLQSSLPTESGLTGEEERGTQQLGRRVLHLMARCSWSLLIRPIMQENASTYVWSTGREQSIVWKEDPVDLAGYRTRIEIWFSQLTKLILFKFKIEYNSSY